MLSLQHVNKQYQLGDATVHALRDVSLTVEEGDFVAIMGPSGSGKSTLMHVLGLLDVPDSGSYEMDGHDITHLSEDELAVLRRDVIGFIFQQFNLLPRISALENVSLPLLYSERHFDFEKARKVLERVDLGARIHHKPNELSGGQQQRVAIARALINNPRIIFADEPTGNLDSKSSQEIISLLQELNQQGITVIIVTHEEEIGRQARRLIRMRDGAIQSDERSGDKVIPPKSAPRKTRPVLSFNVSELWEHFRQGFRTLAGNKIRTGLSILGILIGVAAVVAMMALGLGAQKAIEAQFSSLGSNLLTLRPGAYRVGGVSLDTGTVTRLTLDDVSEIGQQVPQVLEVAATVSGRGQASYEDKNWSTQILGTSPAYDHMHAATPEIGSFFTDEENLQRKRIAVVGATVVRELFGSKNPIGEIIKLNKVSFQIIGLLPEKGATSWRDQDDVIVIPVLTAMHRLLGKEYVDSIDIQVENSSEMEVAQQNVLDLMATRHKVPLSQQKDAFQIRNMADIQAAVSESSRTMSILLACIAAISLLVGGIGIMNIMLVSVTERTHEIGLRKAVGARRRDILNQFLIEAMAVSVVGGLSGILFGWSITEILGQFSGWATAVSLTSVFLAFFFSMLIGMVFGIYPAQKAAKLNPIDALRFQ